MTALVVSNVLLWLLVVALALTVAALARQIGILHERVAPAGAMSSRDGLKIGEEAPAFDLVDYVGRPVRVGGEREGGRSQLVFFLSATCPVCKTLLPTLERVARDEEGGVDLVLASDGPAEEHADFVAEHDLTRHAYVLSGELGRAFQVAKLPYAVLLDASGVLRAKGLVNTREHLESLFEAKDRGVAFIQDFVEGERERA